ncbi:hypothetical protein MRX96_005175 [Rhipicephalus microplus]
MVAKNHFCLFTQLALVIRTCIPVCVVYAVRVPKFGTCPLPEACSDIGADFLGALHPLCDATLECLRKAATTSTATTVDCISSGAATMVAKNDFCLFTQLALVIGTCIPVCVVCAGHVSKSGTCPLPEACSDIGADFLGPPSSTV